MQPVFAANPGVECNRQRDIARFCQRALRAVEVGRRDADNGERHIGNRDDASDDLRIGGEVRTPVPLAEHHDRRCRGAVIARLDGAAGTGAHAEDRKVVAGDQQTADGFRASIHHDCHERDRDRSRQIDHRLVGFAEVLVHRIWERRSHRAERALGHEPVVARIGGHVIASRGSQAHQRIRVADGERAQQHPVDGGEDRRIRADADRQRQHHNGRPSPGLHQHPQTVAKVSQHDEAIIKRRADGRSGNKAGFRCQMFGDGTIDPVRGPGVLARMRAPAPSGRRASHCPRSAGRAIGRSRSPRIAGLLSLSEGSRCRIRSLLTESDDGQVLVRALENNLMLAMREIELRIPDSGARETAEQLQARVPASYAAYFAGLDLQADPLVVGGVPVQTFRAQYEERSKFVAGLETDAAATRDESVFLHRAGDSTSGIQGAQAASSPICWRRIPDDLSLKYRMLAYQPTYSAEARARSHRPGDRLRRSAPADGPARRAERRSSLPPTAS